MFVRINSIYSAPDKIHDAIDAIETLDRPLVEAATGNGGLATFVDLDADAIVAASYWDEPLSSCASGLTRAREAAQAASGGELVAESYELAVAATLAAAVSGGVVLLARLCVNPADMAETAEFFRGEVLPGLASRAGLSSFELMVDRDFGTGLAVTGWHDRAAARGVREVVERLHDRAADEVGAKLLPVETYSMIHSSNRLHRS
jgi:hypothetical protein